MEEKEIKSPLKAIKAFCIECCGDSYNEMKRCPATNCKLYPFRFGKNPYLKKEMTEEQRKAASERMKELREKNR